MGAPQELESEGAAWDSDSKARSRRRRRRHDSHDINIVSEHMIYIYIYR